MTSSQKTSYDIAIVGAGLVGTSVVLGLQEAGFRIAVLEHHLPEVMTTNTEDSRPLSLAYGSKVVLDRWGVWSALSDTACPIKTVHVSEQGRFGRIKFSAADYDLPALGYVIPFSLLQQQLYQKAASQGGVHFIPIEKLTDIQRDSTGATICYQSVEGAQTIQATLLIAADGARSTCRQLLHIDSETEDLGEVARISTIELAAEHQVIAYERFTKKGTMAILPLLNHKQCRLVWTMEKTLSEQVTQWDEVRFLSEIQNTFGERLGELCALKKEATFPLQTTLVEEVIQDSVVLLGNAAHTIYPLAAQGFNLGLHDAAALARTLVHAKRYHHSVGALAVLQRYVERRKRHQKRIIRLTNGIANVFRWQWALLSHCRAMSLLGIDLVPFLKNDVARTLMHI